MNEIQITPSTTLQIVLAGNMGGVYPGCPEYLLIQFFVGDFGISIFPTAKLAAQWSDALRVKVTERDNHEWFGQIGLHDFPKFPCDQLTDEGAAYLLDVCDTINSLVQDFEQSKVAAG